jgi:hypothetical protein
VLDINDDKTNTKAFEMEGRCPFGGDRIGGTLGTPPQLSDWYPDRLKVEQLHSNGPRANPDRFSDAEAGHQVLPDIVGRMVAIRLWQLWSADGPHGVARGWHLSDR